MSKTGLTFDEGTVVTVTPADGKVTECGLVETKVLLEDAAIERCDMLQRRVAALEKAVEGLDRRTTSSIRF